MTRFIIARNFTSYTHSLAGSGEGYSFLISVTGSWRDGKAAGSVSLAEQRVSFGKFNPLSTRSLLVLGTRGKLLREAVPRMGGSPGTLYCGLGLGD
jgi:hypothetical protein